MPKNMRISPITIWRKARKKALVRELLGRDIILVIWVCKLTIEDAGEQELHNRFEGLKIWMLLESI